MSEITREIHSRQERLNRLSPAKRALLLRAVKQGAAVAAEGQKIRRRGAGEVWPLSFGQQRLWFLEQLEPGTPLYNIPTVLRLIGSLDIRTLALSLNQVVLRHEILRTELRLADGGPVQVVLPSSEVPLPLVDLGGLPRERREPAAVQLASEETRRPFYLDSGPLLRALLLRLEEGEHLATLTVHHIVSDAWSKGVLVRDLTTLYRALSTGDETPLPELPIQYADFAVWQRGWLSGDELERQLAYWRRELTPEPPALELPTDRTRPPVMSFRGANRSFSLSPSLTTAVKQLARREGTTLFVALLAAFQALLHRYSGQDDIAVGSPVAGRNRAETADLIGFFINTLVLRTRFDGAPDFSATVRRAHRAVIAAADHQDVPFEKLVDEIKVTRDLSRTPLFQVMLILQNTPREELDLPGLSVRPVDLRATMSKFELVLSIVEAGDLLRGGLGFMTDLFDGSTVTRLAGHLETLLAAAVADPRQRVAELPLLGKGECQQLLREWSGVAFAVQPGEWLPQAVSRQAALRGDAVAAVCGDARLTYGELEARANRLAHHLRSLGVGPEAVVGLFVERSLKSVVGMLGILKAGGAYLPLESGQALERVRFMLADAGALAVVTERLLAGSLPPELPQVLLDEDSREIDGWPATAPDFVSTPQSAAYVIYTSGSTGRPKGVVVPHSNVTRLVGVGERLFRFTPEDVWTVFHSFSFDYSVWEIWGALLTGARAVIVDYWTSRAPEAFCALLRRERVTILSQTPSAFRPLIQAEAATGRPEELELRSVVFAGEALDPAMLAPWFERHGDRSPLLVNMYGITETTVHTTYRPMRESDVNGGSLIGPPLPEWRIHLLDPAGQPVAVGVTGEICVGGSGLARGYLNRPDLTAERFVPDPFTDVPGERLYRSGDLGRYRSDGDIEYLGRIDHQLKVRGFRIEPGEIVTALLQHPRVREAVVIARVDPTGAKRLVAYIVPGEGGAPSAVDLRPFLSGRLPEHMVPAAFVFLDAMPLTPNGKIDRRALPDPEGDRTGREAYVAPRTPVEQALAKVWEGVLRIEKVGIHDNFFALGGDSILSIQIVSRSARVGVHITPKQLFQHQTLAELAAAASTAAMVAAEQGMVTGELPLTPIQAWFFEQPPAEAHHNNQAVLVQVRGELDAAELPAVVTALLAHHDTLRLRFERSMDGSWRQSLAGVAGEPPCSTLDLSSLPEELRRGALEAAAGEVQGSLDLAAGPLVRFVLFDYGQPEPSRLLIAAHHLTVDGVSWRILLEDLAQACREMRDPGRRIALPPKTTSYKAWAERLTSYARSAKLAEQLEFWTGMARADRIPLPLDHPGGEGSVASTRSVSVALEADETTALLQDVPKAYRTQINDVLLTALARALASWTGSGSVQVDLEGHGREDLFEDVDLSRTVGWFTSIFPVRLDVPETADPGEALRAVKERLRSIPDRGIGYGILRYLGEREAVRQIAELPPSEVSFNYLGQLDQVFEAQGPLAPARESRGPLQSPRQRRRYLLDFGGRVAGGRLFLSCAYSESLHDRETVARLVEKLREELRGLIAHCTAPGVSGVTPSDFPLARLAQPALDRLVNGIDVEDIYPLSPLQQGLLFHAVHAAASASYRQQLSCIFQGKLDVAAFTAAWQRVLDRHPILRTAFVWEGLDRPLQIVHRHVEVALHQEDWSGLPDGEQRRQLEAFLAADREKGFDLLHPPVMRLSLLRLGPETHAFTWSFHHIVWDGWSFPALIGETFALYGALSSGKGEAVLLARRPYRDYIEWIERQSLDAAQDYWLGILRGFTAPTPLTASLIPPSHPEERGYHQVRHLLPIATTTKLQARARRQQLTPNTLVQGAMALLLGRYTGEHDVVFGAVSSGRSLPLPGIEQMVGLFINTLPVRIGLPATAETGGWLQAIQAEQLEARQYEYSPLAQVQLWSEVPRGQALFEVILNFENYPIDDSMRSAGGGGLRISDVRFLEATSYPLAVMVTPGTKLAIRTLYDPSILDEAGVRRLLAHLENLLAELAEDRPALLRDLDLLSPADRQQIVIEWNDTEAPFERNRLLHELFEQQVARSPEALAVSFEDERLTYAGLNRRANQLAHLLRRLGVGPGSAVGIHLERSAEMVVALLAVLKAGGVYVPLDAALPAARMRWILGSVGSSWLLTKSRMLAALGEVFNDLPALSEVVCLDGGEVARAAGGPRIWSSHDLALLPDSDPAPLASSEDDAYIIFTSGSTGTPKGVVVRHAPVINLIEWINRTFDVGPADRVLFITSLSFDLSVYDVFGLLAAGGSIRVASSSDLREPQRLIELLVGDGITFWDSAPAALQQLVPSFPAEPARDSRLRLVFLSGDWIPVALPGRVRASFPAAEVIALGGATEATVWSNFHRTGEPDPRWVSVPYGRPIQNARYLVLDERLEPCPVGVPGDLYIGGDCLASGYSREPVLTANQFMPDGFRDRPGVLYRTGDRARFWPDGKIEFLGRLDHQVKIRGFRIELGEIEAVLNAQPGVRDAVVMAREDEPGHKRLVAYVVAGDGPVPAAGELRAALLEKLPEYMVPAFFLPLDALPVTANGKLDRKALPAPDVEGGVGGTAPAALAAPRTPVEAALVAIWSKVLPVKVIGIHDNFFELGGDSILSLQIISRASQEGLRLTTALLFEYPTVAELAEVVGTEGAALAEQGSVQGEAPLTPPQSWFFEGDPTDIHHFNLSLLLELDGADPAPLSRATDALVEHHDALRLRFTRGAEGGWRQIHAAAPVPGSFICVALDALPESRRQGALEHASARLQESFDLEAGPLLRVALFQMGAGESQRLLLAAHHLVVDGVSMRILLDDLLGAAGRLASGAGVELPAKTTSYQRWAERLVARAAELRQEAEFWLGPRWLAAAPLPRDRADGGNRVASQRAVFAALTAAETTALLQQVPRAYRTQINDALLAAFAEALTTWTGSRRVLVELEGHGREEIAGEDLDLTRTVGWFTSFYPVLLDLTGTEGPGGALKAVKEQLRGIPGRGLGHGLLRYLGDPETAGRLRAMPPAEVVFNYLGQLDRGMVEGAPLRLARESAGPGQSPRRRRRYLLDVECRVTSGRLVASFRYSDECHSKTMVEGLAESFLGALRAIIAHCLAAKAGGATPSDFQLARLTQRELDRLEEAHAPIEDVYPLSPLQLGMLFHTLRAPESGVYVQQLTCSIYGPLDAGAFELAWRRVVERHAILRTAFVWEHLEEPLQVVAAAVEVPFERLDWRAASEAEQAARFAELVRAERGRGVGLDRAPLLRLVLARTGEEAYRFLWTHHHLLLDGWSLPILFRELFAFYEGERRGELPAAERPRAYRDFIAWLQQRDRASSEAFWRRYLEGFAAPTVIDGRHRARIRQGEPESRDEHWLLATGTTTALSLAAQSFQLTLNTLVQGAWGLLLSRFADQPDVVFGVVSAGRPPELPGVESMLGLFITTVPARVRVEAQSRVAQWLHGIQAEQVAARQHEFSSLNEIQGWSEVPHGEPLFETILLFENYPVAEVLGQQRLSIAVRDVHMEERTNYPLNLTVLPGRELRLLISYDCRRFERATILRLLGSFETILQGLARDGDRRLEDVPMLREAERHQLLGEWNDTAIAFPYGLGIHQLFERQAAATPAAAAVEQGETSVSYAELDRRAARLARHLRQMGVGPEVRVGLHLDRSPDLAVGILGVLKAGGAYLPLDPALPQDRLRLMLQDGGVRIVVTQKRLRPGLGTLDPERVVAVGSDLPELQDELEPWRPPSPENLAYLLYTSGSTGMPKAVLVTHGSLVNHGTNAARAYGLRAGDRVLQFASIGFDMLAEDLFPTWLAGGTVVFPASWEVAAPSEFTRFAAEARLSVLNLPTAYWSEWIGELAATGQPLPPSLRMVVVGSETVPCERADLWRRLAGDRMQWRNAYGVTEATVAAAIYRPREIGGVEAPASVPIGRAIANFRLYALDRSLRPVPIGVAGELVIGGSGLARGYHGRPDLTAERFVPEPFGDEPGGRLYRTGDLVRFLPDGDLEFLGRVDHQIKVRGFRVELGEIEAALAQHQDVREAVVVLRTDPLAGARICAYVVPAAAEIEIAGVREFLRQRLPEYMVPTSFTVLAALPLTAHGKVDRRALPAPEAIAPARASGFVPPANEVERTVAEIWEQVLGLEAVGVHDNFFDLGGHSLLLLKVYSKLRGRFRNALTLIDLFRFPTIHALAEHLEPAAAEPVRLRQGPARAAARQKAAGSAAGRIAIIGMDCRFPGAGSVAEYWRNLSRGVESVTFFSDEELIAAGVDPAALGDPAYVKAKAVIEGAELFDASFFGINPREAEILDPQHRLFLECAWNALESAGYDPDDYPGAIGVFAGASMSTYLLNLYSQPEIVRLVGTYQVGLANDKDFLPMRVSYKLNLRGPSLNVNTACSTSAVAVHLACRSLLSGESDMAMAGGASIGLPQTAGYLFQEGGILSPDGHCRTFDARARGTLSGSGVGVVLLKRLDDALADGDTIHAVILGSAINNDGSLKVGFTAPSVEGQAAVISEALTVAGIEPATIQYVEAHGTATPLGDPIEIAALSQAFAGGAEPGSRCAIGSVKSNFGHLDAAAGVAGLIKTVLGLEHRQIPPSLHFEEPNPEIGLGSTPFFVNTKLAEWPDGGTPRRAGVSSFGIGGTNAHLLLEEAPEPFPAAESRPWELFVLSAKTESALATATENLARHLEENPGLAPGDVAFTLQAGRRAFRHRRMVVCQSLSEAVQALRAGDPGRARTAIHDGGRRPIVFMFPGQGAQYPGMGEELYHFEPVFRDQVDACAALLEPHLGCDLRHVLFPAVGGTDDAAARLRQTAWAQPSLFVIEYALARLWSSWGVRPQALVGHSVGEYVAACLAGVFTLADALRLVALRGRMIQELPAGSMLSIALPPEALSPLLGEELSLAALNAPSLTVVSGPDGSIAALERELADRQVECRRLHTSHAFHSAMMEPILDRFAEEVGKVELNAPRIPWISNLTGTWIQASQATDPRYWADHLRQPVRFSAGLEELQAEPGRIFLEVGPGRSLTTLVAQRPGAAGELAVVPSLPHPQDRRSETRTVMEAVGRLWLAGVRIDWTALHRPRRRRVPLPTYPFERQRYWVERRREPAGVAPRPGKQADLADWFYAPSWKRTAPVPALAGGTRKERWLLFADGSDLASELARHLQATGIGAILVRPGECFAASDDGYRVDPGSPDDYSALFAELDGRGDSPAKIIHLWTAAAGEPTGRGALDLGFHSLVALAQAYCRRETRPIEISVVSSGVFQVTGDEALEPERAALLGPCRVLPREFPGMSCRLVDLPPRTTPSLVERLAAELAAAAAEPAVAYRGTHRWVQTFDPVRLEQDGDGRIREGGVYLVTGGLGAMGLTLAERIAAAARVKLVLIGRSELPPPELWDRPAEADGGRLQRRVAKLRELERLGAEVLVLQADVADRLQMEAVKQRVLERFGAVNGIVHAAGVSGGGPVQLGTREVTTAVLAPKVEGTRILADLFGGEALDFLVLCSSMDSFLGAFGQTDYCAANAYLDCFAHTYGSATGTFTVAINWDAWRELGMAVDALERLGRGAGADEALREAIRPAEGAEVFARVLAGWRLPQVVVSTQDLRGVIQRAMAAARPAQPAGAPAEGAHARPLAESSYVAPRNAVEEAVAAIWQELLGIEAVGVHDDFFELRGHSLLATRVLTRVREAFQVDLALADIFEAPTVAGLSEMILKKRLAGEEGQAVADVLAELEQLSEEDVSELLAEEHVEAEPRD